MGGERAGRWYGRTGHLKVCRHRYNAEWEHHTIPARPSETEEARGRRLGEGGQSTVKTNWDKIKLHLLCDKAKGQPGPGLSCVLRMKDTCPGWPALTLALKRHSLLPHP